MEKKATRTRVEQPLYADVLIIGCGAAGMRAALSLADAGRSVLLMYKASTKKSASWEAQGGIAAVLGEDDSLESHAADTLAAGAGLCDAAIVNMAVAAAPSEVRRLMALGVDFDQHNASLMLTLEGGHSHNRIVHVLDHTGKAISNKLFAHVKKHPQIQLLDDVIAIDLINAANIGSEPTDRIVGAYVYSIKRKSYMTLGARCTILATGGASKAYLYSTNAGAASGDGIAIAWRAGAIIANMEFNQFHPTFLYHAHAQGLLLTEALRGEGAVLRLPNGTPFASSFDARGELAPRDIVARGIDFAMKRFGLDCVYLDISHKPSSWIRQRFPEIYSRCKKLDIDITKQPIPVVPAAHYTCGGVRTDSNGATNIHGLFAIGETACTGLHGANRLASNSLLECLVFGSRAASWIDSHIESFALPERLPHWDTSRVQASSEDVLINHNWEELRRAMWNYVGIVRNDTRLYRAKKRIDWLFEEVHDYYARHELRPDVIELRNLVQTARLIVECAQRRKESRGLHYTLDYTGQLPQAVDTWVRPPL